VHLGVDRQGDRRVLAQGRELRGVLRRAHDDLRAVPGEPDRDIAGCAVRGDVRQAGQVAGQQFLAERSVQHLGDLVRLHGGSPSLPRAPLWPLVSLGRSRRQILDIRERAENFSHSALWWVCDAQRFQNSQAPNSTYVLIFHLGIKSLLSCSW
jgi:hypothetical protein